MISNLNEELEAEFEVIRDLAPSGFALVTGFSMDSTTFSHVEYHETWKKLYIDNSYYAMDPVFVWAIAKTGSCRWSEINLPDVKGIMEQAAAFGLRYGVVFAEGVGDTRAFLAAGRADREYEDKEIALLGEHFANCICLTNETVRLTEGEIAVLRAIYSGMAQREIAESLNISESTVKQRALGACKKLGAKTRAQAVGIAVARRYI